MELVPVTSYFQTISLQKCNKWFVQLEDSNIYFWDLEMNKAVWIIYRKNQKKPVLSNTIIFLGILFFLYLYSLYFQILPLTLVSFCCALPKSCCHLLWIRQDGFYIFTTLVSTEYDFYLNMYSDTCDSDTAGPSMLHSKA